MASPCPTSTFRSDLLKASDRLSEADVKKLTFLCEKIPLAKSEKITSGIELFAELQLHDLLSEDNVSTLIGWMDELHLAEAVKPLEKYRKNHTVETDAVLRHKCLIHQDQTLKYFCVSCNMKVCPECIVQSHKSDTCGIIGMDRIRHESNARSEKLLKKIESALSNARITEELWEEDIKMLMSDPNIRASSDIDKLFKQVRQIQHLKTSLEQLKTAHRKWSHSSVQDLQRIIEAEKKIREIQIKIEEQKRTTKKRTVDEAIHASAETDNGGSSASGVTPSSMLVGGAAINTRLFVIHDKRRLNGEVIMSHVDSSDMNKEDWRYAIEVGDQTSPVVMSYITMGYDSKKHVLFAVGKTVYIVRPHWTGSVFDSVESVTPVEISDVPERSWITSISAHRQPGSDPCGKFLISVNNSKTIREYKTTGEAVRVINTSDSVPSNGITCVAYCRNVFALIDRETGEVILLSADGTVQRCGSLKPASAGLRPKVVIWTGFCWLVLFIGEGAVKQWEVAHYEETGELVKVCERGTSSNDLEQPVCIARFSGTGYVILANNIIRTFSY